MCLKCKNVQDKRKLSRGDQPKSGVVQKQEEKETATVTTSQIKW